MNKKYIRKILEEKGYTILGEINTTNDKVLCETCDGYKVLVTPSGVIHRNDTPKIFSQYNPYTIDNLKLLIKQREYTCRLLSDEYINSKSKLEFVCECGTHYQTTSSELLKGKCYCNFCSKSKRYDTVDFTDYNKLVKEECDKRGYILLPNQNIRRSTDVFYYICNKHKDYGVQKSLPNNFITQYGDGGCYKCCVEKRSHAKRKDESYFRSITEEAGMIYCGVKYSDNDKTRILYQCPKHIDKGVQSTYISNMKSNKGNCPYCMGKFRSQEDLQKELDDIGLCVDILKYDSYSKPILARCRICGNEWYTQGVYLTQGVRCPQCSMSKFELSVKNILDDCGVKYETQYTFKDCKDVNVLPFDFYLPEYNTLIETDGEGHYKPIQWSGTMSEQDAKNNLEYTKKHDAIKTDYCKANGLNLIRIPYWNCKDIQDILFRELQITNQ